ncbi:MAG TPA: radical SAM protein [Vicinamibacteria bacterium]|nr:radical SAM protein [Vicinamibacteria bacterium]
MSLPAAALPRYPWSPLVALDTLWFQVAGTLCNIQCRHCFISSSPTNHAHEMMSLQTVRTHLEEAAALGVREYYFTGGEPFLNRELLDMLEATLRQGPATVLTNGLLVRPETARRLRGLADGSAYSLDLRVSIDGWDAATNDPIRGAGTFDRIMAGLAHLAEAGINPVLTVTEACAGAASAAGRTRFLEFLRAAGLRQPRLKVMPLLRLGAEADRTRAYAEWESLAGRTLTAEEAEALQCSSSRMVTARGVYVCPILIDFPAARLASSLAGALRPFELSYRACYTCHEQGLSCRT